MMMISEKTWTAGSFHCGPTGFLWIQRFHRYNQHQLLWILELLGEFFFIYSFVYSSFLYIILYFLLFYIFFYKYSLVWLHHIAKQSYLIYEPYTDMLSGGSLKDGSRAVRRAVAVLRYFIFYGFCIPRVAENQRFFSYY